MKVSSLSRATARTVCCIVALIASTAAFAGGHAKPAPKATAEQISAAANVASVATQAAASAGETVSLAALGNLNGALRLAGASASRSISIPLSARERVRDAVLHLVVSNSISLLTDRSELAVRVNDRTIAQLQLSSRQPEATADIRVPSELLRPGYNTLTFAVAQHSTENCEDPNAPELWTEIDTSASTLQMQTALAPLTPTLADLSNLIDPKQWSARALTIVNASHPNGESQLADGSLVAQGIALRLRYLSEVPRVLDAEHGSGAGMLPGLALAPLADTDVVLIGSRDALRGYLDDKTVAQIDGAFLGIYPKPDDARRFVLVVSGRNDAEVERAARAFAHSEVPLPRSSALVIGSFDETTLPPWSTDKTLTGTAPHRFRDLGFSSRTLHSGDAADLDVRLPADIYAPEDAKVTLDLNFTEGAKMREDSILNILLNGRFEQVVALDQQQGAVMRHYRISIPLRDFRAGLNTLSLRALLVPLVTDRCALRNTQNLEVTLFDDSTVTLPAASHFTTLPNLERFADSGFPYTVRPDGSDLALRLAAHDDKTIAAAWTLMGRLAQSQAAPLTAAQLTFDAPATARHDVILIGAASALPRPLLKHAPWSPGASIRIADDATVPADPQGGGALPLGLGHLLGSQARAALADVTLRGDVPLSHQLLVMQYRGERGGAMTVLTAADAGELADGIGRLVEPNYWSELRGDISLLTFDRPDLWTGRVGGTYEEGTLGPLAWLGFTLSAHPWLGYVALVLLLSIFAGSSALLLKRYHRKRHRGTEE
ncbi:cellulose biosynthesis cyclic di-GMP-binding regulatory protein BcsB [Trinickia dinghuensis]|uniref:Cyclic di-GMP-binding protein n=1 Tax=Trinickia dinghuensis TaxID=2291023 RepID=A0A3D8JPY7_9BURK|nr:cellulose biosynthesis cyclic di-GMP-binding regulatory protein BcsB [Trinickia dinghuensis]RDU94775.1 cellulose biosynthesis cyclic di-GMP-binding regulatory protein BcsB [Trinickia dinghuensis]